MDGAVSKSNPSLLNIEVNLSTALELLCVGGASLLVMAVCICLNNPSILIRNEVRMMLAQLAASSLLFPSLLSYPHSMWSFRFAYFQGRSFLTRHSFALLIFPSIIASLLVLSALTWSIPVSAVGLAAEIEKSVNSIGIGLNWTKYNSLGQLILSLLLITQISMSGYHYGMQAVGVAIACGERRGYRLCDQQKKYLRYNVYALWLVNLLSGYTFLSILDSHAFGYRAIRFPDQWKITATLLFVASLFLVWHKIISPLFKQNQALPPLSATIAMISLWLWLQPYFQPFGFQATVVPLAHALQYLYFAARAEAKGFGKEAARAGEGNLRSNLLFTLLLFCILIPLGYFAYKYAPIALDRTPLVKDLAPNFYLLCAYIFLNVHHYMVDSVIWRKDSRLYALLK